MFRRRYGAGCRSWEDGAQSRSNGAFATQPLEDVAVGGKRDIEAQSLVDRDPPDFAVLVAEHARETQSRYAAQLLNDWELVRDRFWQVVPIEMIHRLEHPVAEDDRFAASRPAQ